MDTGVITKGYGHTEFYKLHFGPYFLASYYAFADYKKGNFLYTALYDF